MRTGRLHLWGSIIGGVTLLGACTGPPDEVTNNSPKPVTQCRLSHASFTTFDPNLGGCLQGQNPNGIDCNIYDAKEHVYVSGGPLAAGLPAGDYFFAVLVPGF